MGKLFGYGEVSMHLFQALFTFLDIFLFYLLAQLFAANRALLLTALFTLSPAFLVNQNLMLDIPLLSLQLAMMYVLLKPGEFNWKRYALAATFFGLSMLIKYSSLPMIGLIGLSILVQRRFILLWTLFIPAAILGLYSAFNWWDFGGIHLNNPVYEPTTMEWVVREFQAFLIILGAISPFVLVFVSGFFSGKKVLKLAFWIVALALMVGLPIVAWIYGIGVDGELWMRRLFTFMGLIMVGLAMWPFVRFRSGLLPESFHQRVILFAWAWCMIIFMVPLAPFMATRHVLLILPPLLLLAAPFLNKTTKTERNLTLTLTLILGLLLSISDWHYANFYRQTAPEVSQKIPQNSTTWTVGHWGWQWYATQEGMQFYETNLSEVKPGEYFVIPKDVAGQYVPDSLRNQLEWQFDVSRKPTWATFYATHGFARFYNSYFWKAPWTFSKEELDRIEVYRVKEKVES
ncbi:glycosyltransferase family 39 protein [bacterium SCSIO 12741]|nr:glycosyltransferase family 39 protein [bacterium SCSIO 12741]